MSTTNTVKTPAEKAEMFRRLETLKAGLIQDGCNRNQQVIALIIACLNEDLTAGPAIVGAIAHLGYNGQHVGKMLHDNLGHMWQRDGFRIYRIAPQFPAD